MSFDREALKARLIQEEGRKNIIYTDTAGNITAGIGRNLSRVGFTDDEIELMYVNDVNRAVDFLDNNLSWWTSLDDVRQSVLVDMTFNMGSKILQFTNMLEALQASDWAKASDQMLDSLWARQVGSRARNLARIMLTGSL
jgi:GH24 family phage-related lysozyme (muramidase)